MKANRGISPTWFHGRLQREDGSIHHGGGRLHDDTHPQWQKHLLAFVASVSESGVKDVTLCPLKHRQHSQEWQ